MEIKAGTRVAVAMSGGMDSTAAAILLKKCGCEVLGLTMLLASPAAERLRFVDFARTIADRLGVEHLVLDVSGEFERLVVEPFLDGYLGGITPNPCVTCNRKIKFGILLDEASRRGFDFLATGHYAIVTGVGESYRRIYRASDRRKDQSYVLWTMDQATLARVIFPIGKLSRSTIESLVADAGLLGIVVPESQDICFLNGGSYRDLVESRAPGAYNPGPIVDTSGKRIGTHNGLPFYTVGQRRGLRLGSEHALFVLEILPDENKIVVGGKGDSLLDVFSVSDLNLIEGHAIRSIDCSVQTRYRGEPKAARLEIEGEGRGRVICRDPGPPVAPGQSAAFYDGERLLGGGVIYR